MKKWKKIKEISPKTVLFSLTILFIFTALIGMWYLPYWLGQAPRGGQTEVPYYQFEEMVTGHMLAEEPTIVNRTILIVQESTVLFQKNGEELNLWTSVPATTKSTPYEFMKFYGLKPGQSTEYPWGWALFMGLSMNAQLILFLVFIYLIYDQRKEIAELKNLGKSGARKILGPQVSFDKVAGIDEVKNEAREVIDYIREPKPYLNVGALMPHGILISGPPGNGKTFLAYAMIHESKLPPSSVFMMTGSEFHEMLIGVGPARVRNLYKDARENAPSIVFLDEIDAAAPKRSSSNFPGEREGSSLVNQILTELDVNEKGNLMVFTIAVTNRPDILDPALIRAGRLDRHLEVNYPRFDGRKAILQTHFNWPLKRPVDPDINIDTIARHTEGFTGADLAILVNEAALRIARERRKIITLNDFELSIDRVLMGPEKLLKYSEEEEKVIAYHEAGHALIAKISKETDPVFMVSILPRGRSLGYTRYLPDTERHLISDERILSQVKRLLAGGAAEKNKFGKVFTGSTGDYEKATSLIRNFVCVWGMSDLGQVYFGNPQEAFWSPHAWSQEILAKVDSEIMAITEKCSKDIEEILGDHINNEKLDDLAGALIERKRLTAGDIDKIIG